MSSTETAPAEAPTQRLPVIRGWTARRSGAGMTITGHWWNGAPASLTGVESIGVAFLGGEPVLIARAGDQSWQLDVA